MVVSKKPVEQRSYAQFALQDGFEDIFMEDAYARFDEDEIYKGCELELIDEFF